MSPYGDSVWMLEGSLADALRSAIKEKPLAYLTLGRRAGEVAKIMHGIGGSGISILDAIPDEERDLFDRLWRNVPSSRHKHVLAYVTPDPRLVQVLDGTWRKSLTIEALFTQFPGPYKVVAAIESGQDRTLLEHKCILACDPQALIIGEDGHNEELVKSHLSRGYRCSIVDGCLMMVKP